MSSCSDRLRCISRFYWFAAIVLLAVGIWSAASDTLFAKKGGDGQIDYLPSRVFSAQVFRAGSLPLWDPHIFSGMSHLAIVQTAPFYPLNIALYLLLPSTVAFNVSMALHLLLLLGFSHAFLRLLAERDEAAWLGAVVFSCNGFLLLHLEAIGIFNSAAWIPTLFYCVEKWIRTRDWRFSAAGGVCLAMQLLAGWPQMVLLSAIYVGIYFLAAVREQPRRWQLLAGLLVMGLVSAGLGAIEVLPTMEFKPYSNLAVLAYNHFRSNSIAPQTLLTLLFPYLMGADYTTYHSVPWFGPAQMVVTASYVGILPLMLAVASLVSWRRSRYVRFATCSAVVAGFLACGGLTPIAPLLYRLPVYNFFRDHRVNILFFAFSVAMLATLAAGNLPELAPSLRSKMARAVPVGFIAVAALLLIEARAILSTINQRIAPLHPQWVWWLHHSMRFSNRDMILAWLTIVLAGLLFWAWMKRPASTALAWLAIAFVAADLLWFGMSDQPHFSRGHATEAETKVYEAARAAANGRPFRSMSLARDAEFISTNLNEMAGVDDIYGYSALVPRQYADLLPISVFELPHWPELMANNAILSLLNTRFIFARGDIAKVIDNQFIVPAVTREEASTGTPENMLASSGWVALQAGEQVNLADPFQCSRPPCGMQQAGLMLQKNSIYELRFTVAAASRIADLDVLVAPHNWWKALRSFTVSNGQLSTNATPYLDVYVTGPQDEFVDLRFSTNYSTPLRVSEISLARVGALPAGPYREIANDDGIVVVENQNALPRAFFVPKITAVSGYEEARNRLWDPVSHFEPRQEALVEGISGNETVGSGSVDKMVYSPNRVNLDVSCPQHCYLVLADLYLPGWHAAIDGSGTEIYRTDGVVRGMFVPAGSHHVEFRYRPRSIVIGLWSMAGTLVALVLLWLRTRS